MVQKECNRLGVNAVSEVWAKGGEGGLELGKEVVRIIERR